MGKKIAASFAATSYFHIQRFYNGKLTVSPPVANTPNRKFGPIPFWQTQWADPVHNDDSILE